MIAISVDERIIAACPQTRIGLVSATVHNGPTSDELWAEIEDAARGIKSQYELLAINQRPDIAATRRL